MKGIYFPDSIKRFGLRYCSPFAKALFYELIAYSDAKYSQKIYPSVETMQRAFTRIDKKGKKIIASKNTIISAIKELESAGIVTRQAHFEKNRQTTNRIIIDFAFWESIDRARGIKFGSKIDESLRMAEMQKELREQSKKIDLLDQRHTERLDYLTFGMKNLSDNLLRYLYILDYKTEIDGVKVFTRKNPLINEFAELSVRQEIESEFKREGILIRIEKAS